MGRPWKLLTLLLCCLMAVGLAAQHSREFDALAMNRRGAKGNTVLLVADDDGRPAGAIHLHDILRVGIA